MFGTPRKNRTAYVFCVHRSKNATSECLDVPSSWGISGAQASEEPAGTHELKPDRTTGELLLAVGCRDGRPIVDFGSVVSTCPVDHVTSVPTEKVNDSWWSFQNNFGRLGLVKAELKCDEEPKTLDVANALSANHVVTATPKRLERELGTSKFDNSGTAASISGSRLIEIQNRNRT